MKRLFLIAVLLFSFVLLGCTFFETPEQKLSREFSEGAAKQIFPSVTSSPACEEKARALLPKDLSLVKTADYLGWQFVQQNYSQTCTNWTYLCASYKLVGTDDTHNCTLEELNDTYRGFPKKISGWFCSRWVVWENNWTDGTPITPFPLIIRKGSEKGENINYLYAYAMTPYSTLTYSKKIIGSDGTVLGTRKFSITQLVLKLEENTVFDFIRETKVITYPTELGKVAGFEILDASFSNCEWVD